MIQLSILDVQWMIDFYTHLMSIPNIIISGFYAAGIKNIMMSYTFVVLASYIHMIHYTVVWEKLMVRNICEKKIRGKKFLSTQAIDGKF